MNDRLDVMELMGRANPVAPAEVPGPREPELLVLEEIIRSSAVPPRISEGKTVTAPRRLLADVWGGRLLGPAVAAASFVAVLAVGLTLWLVASSGRGGEDTAPSVGPVVDALEVGAQWESAMDRSDLDDLMALYADDVTWAGSDKAGLRRFFQGQMAFHARYAITDCLGEGVTVTCQWTSTNVLLSAIGVETVTGSMTFTIHNGFIDRFDAPASPTSAADWDRVVGFFGWLTRTHPELLPQVYDPSPDREELRSQLVTEWVALELVEEWKRTINRGDLDGFMALYAGDATWDTLDRAAIRDFFGWRIGLNAHYEVTDCQVAGDTVTCLWTSTDDFFQAAGVETLTGSMTFTIRDGLVIAQFEGPTSSETAADWDRVLGDFDTWVQDTHPELYDQPNFAFHFTPEMAELELQLVDEWIADQ